MRLSRPYQMPLATMEAVQVVLPMAASGGEPPAIMAMTLSKYSLLASGMFSTCTLYWGLAFTKSATVSWCACMASGVAQTVQSSSPGALALKEAEAAALAAWLWEDVV